MNSEKIIYGPYNKKIIIAKRDNGSIYISVEEGSNFVSLEEKELKEINKEVQRLRRG